MSTPESQLQLHVVKPAPPLTAQQIRFCQLWVEHGKAVRAYRDAGFEAADDEVAKKGARRLLNRPEVQAYVNELQQVAADAARVTIELVAQSLFRDGWADRRKLFGPDGEVLPPHEWPDDVAATVSSVEVLERTEWQPEPGTKTRKKVATGLRWRVKTTDPLSARKVLARWLRMTTGQPPPAPAAPPAPLVIGGEADPGKV